MKNLKTWAARAAIVVGMASSFVAPASAQTVYQVPAAAVTPLPPGVPAARAVLAANLETAINALWDAEPRPGDHIAVVVNSEVVTAGEIAGRAERLRDEARRSGQPAPDLLTARELSREQLIKALKVISQLARQGHLHMHNRI